MALECTVLGRDVEITDLTIPVISPYWRLKRNGDWSLLCRYEQEQINYSLLSPMMGATLSLMDGRLTLRHLSMIIQYAHDFDSLDKAKEFVTEVILATNRESDAVVNMTPELEPFIQKMDPFHFVGDASKAGEEKRPAAPVSLNLMFSNDCETNCAYCNANRRHVPDNMLLSTKRWKELLQEAKSLGIEQVTLSGGDPLFRKDALNLIAELIGHEMLFVLSTKCCITPEIADRLVEIGMTRPINQYIREIQVSMDGPDEHTADKLAGSPGYYSRAVESIRNLVLRGFNLRVKAVVTPLNATRIYEWIQRLAALGVKKISLAAYTRTFHRHNDSLFLTQQDRVSIAEQCERARADFPEIDLRMTGLQQAPTPVKMAMPEGNISDGAQVHAVSGLGNRAEDKVRRLKERGPCSGGHSSMTITPDGKVVQSDTVPQEETFFVGDVSRQSIIEVWNSEALLNFAYQPREKLAGSACHDCENLEVCQSKAGSCSRDTHFDFGTVFAPPPQCPLVQGGGVRME